MPRKDGLPKRWKLHHGAYYYQVPPGLEPQWDGKKLFRLGKSLAEAYRVWAERLEVAHDQRDVSQLIDRYLLEVVPTKEPSTQRNNRYQAEYLRSVFGSMPINSIEPQHIYQYYEKRGRTVSANREVKLLSHVYTKAVEWGLLSRHPFKGQVRLEGEKPRERYVTDEELSACLSMKPKRKGDPIEVVQAYIVLKMAIGLRQTDMLLLKEASVTEDGLFVHMNKTGKERLFEWTPFLRQAVDALREARPVDISPYLICTRRGKCYYNVEDGTASGWSSLWQRFMKRAIDEGVISERFQDKDIRAKAGSDADNEERAREVLAHGNVSITRKHYRRKIEKIKPLK